MADLDDELRAAVQACDAAPVAKADSPRNATTGNATTGNATTGNAATGNAATVRRGGGNVWLLVALLVMGGGTLTLLLSSAEDSARYDVPVDRYLAAKERYVGKTARVEGTLVRGSLVKRDDPCEFRFAIHSKVASDTNNGKAANDTNSRKVAGDNTDPRNGGDGRLAVRYAQCIVPDNFRDAADIDVAAVVTGTLTPAGHFEATHIQPQCPSKYEEAQRRGEVMPHASVQ